ncbi:MAG: hypothetical protein KDC12_07795 [Flavobacteriales bacterium]|nr:hypothetical protein [Flavobacteriales bacterium]
MAQPSNIRLTIENANTRRVDVSVTYTLECQGDELNEDFIETIELWGDDKGFNGKDDKLLTLSSSTINTGNSRSVSRSVERSVIRDMLNEDKTGTDEVYALVKIEPRFAQARRQSEIVRVKIRKKD